MSIIEVPLETYLGEASAKDSWEANGG